MWVVLKQIEGTQRRVCNRLYQLMMHLPLLKWMDFLLNSGAKEAQLIHSHYIGVPLLLFPLPSTYILSGCSPGCFIEINEINKGQ